MNIYIVEDKQLIIAKECKEARHYMSQLFNDKDYKLAKYFNFRKVNKNEISNLLIYNNLGYGEQGESLECHLDNKIGLEIEYFEENNWKHKEE